MNFEEEFGITPTELEKLKTEARNIGLDNDSRLVHIHLAIKSGEMAHRCADKLFGLRRIYSKAGEYTKALWIKNDDWVKNGLPLPNEALDETIERLFLDPALFSDKAIWLFFQVLRQSQREFTLKSCRDPSREEFLSGKLISKLESHSDTWTKIGQTVLRRTGCSLEVKQMDLQILGREGVTGGDFALVLEFIFSGEIRYLPIIFQAKRFTGQAANISQFNKKRGYQNAILRNQKCTSAYIFYENGNESVEHNSPPVVKLVSETDAAEAASHTQVFERSLDFATFILTALDGGDKFPIATNERAALDLILENADLAHLTAIAAISSTPNCDYRYTEAWRSRS